MSEAEVAALGFVLAGPFGLAALGVLLAGVAHLLVGELACAEVGLLAGGGLVAVGVELLADEVDHEHGVDHPDRVGEVLPALVHVGVAAGAGAVADLAGDPDLGGLGFRAGGERVELGLELVGLAAQQRGQLRLRGRGEVGAGALDLLVRVEQHAVVDPHGVGVLVLDDGAVHERAEVLERLVVQLAGGDPSRDRLGQVGRDLRACRRAGLPS